MALSLGQVEDSSTSCLLTRGPSTQLNMVVRDGQWPSSGSSILRPSIMSSQVIFMNSQMACLQLPHTFSQRAEVQIPWQIALLHPVLEALTISYCQEGWLPPYILVGEVCPGGRPLYSDFGGLEVAEYPSSGNILDQTSSM